MSGGWRIESAVVCLLLAGALLGCAQTADTGPEAAAAPEVSDADPLMQAFRAEQPDVEILLSTREEDVTADGRTDLVVIYRISRDSNRMVVVHENGGEIAITNDVPAPIENQRVSFRDIDDVPPVELVVQGTKGAAVGFAIFRVTDGVLEDLFGEGMADCC